MLYYKLSSSKEQSGSMYINIEISTRHIIELKKQATKNDQNTHTSSKIVVTLGKG